jgi:hypothetical protein
VTNSPDVNPSEYTIGNTDDTVAHLNQSSLARSTPNDTDGLGVSATVKSCFDSVSCPRQAQVKDTTCAWSESNPPTVLYTTASSKSHIYTGDVVIVVAKHGTVGTDRSNCFFLVYALPNFGFGCGLRSHIFDFGRTVIIPYYRVSGLETSKIQITLWTDTAI